MVLMDVKIGINYIHHENSGLRLGHSVNDAYIIASFLCGTTLLVLSDMIFSLMISHLENLGFAPTEIRLMTDDHPWDRPDKESIVSHPRETSQPALTLRSDESDERAGSWCPTPRLSVLLLYVMGLTLVPCCLDSPSSFRSRCPDERRDGT